MIAPSPSDPIPAATLVILRDAVSGPPDVLMVERAQAMAFAGGAMVFPGGRVDPGDRLLAARHGGDGEDIAARIAAIRETIEEAGLAIGIEPAVTGAALAGLRRALHAGVPLAAACAPLGAAPVPQAIRPFARWCPKLPQKRNFDTRFYLASVPPGTEAAGPDQTESVGLIWATAAQILADVAAGRRHVIFPTRCNLERLARFATAAEAFADAAAYPPATITPWIERRDGMDFLCIPDDLGYPVTAVPLAGEARG